MSKTAERRVHTGDRLAAEAQQNGRDATRRLNADIFDGGKLLSGLEFVAGTPRTIAHGLGRRAVGWLEMYSADTPSSAHVGLRSSAHATGTTSATHVTVTPSNTGTCSLFVY